MNRIILIVVSLLLCSFPSFSGSVPVAPVPTTPAAEPCDPVDRAITTSILEGRLATLFSRFQIDPLAQRVYFVAVDHRQRQNIFAFRRDPGPIGQTVLKPLSVVRDADGLPEVPVPRNGHVVFVLANTNRPLYSLTKTTTTEPIPGLQDLAAIANGAGQWILSAAQPLPAGFGLRAGPDIDSLRDLHRAFKPVTSLMEQADRAKQSMILRLQYGEYGKSPGTPPAAGNSTDVAGVFAALRAARQEFTETEWGETFGCQDVLDLATRLSTALATPSTAGREIGGVRNELENSKCPAPAKRELGVIIKRIPPDLSNAASLKPVREALDLMIANGTATLAVLKVADQLIAAELPTARTVATLDRLGAAAGANNPCTYTAGLIFADTPDQIPFDKIGTVKVTISEVNPFGVNFDRRPDAAGEQSFRIADPAVRRIAVSVGGIYTPLVERTYSAVTNPLNPNEKVIARTGEQRRSGAVALLAAYRWREERALLRPGIQLGVGFGSRPQLFTGFSLDVSPFVRLGLGATGQYVQDLASGQKALEYDRGNPVPGATVVGGDGEIRLKQRPRFAPYLSLSISLDSLSLFRKP